MRRRLIHSQERTPVYFQAPFVRVPTQEPDRLHNRKVNNNLIGTTRRKITTTQPVSLTDPEKLQRSTYTTNLIDKDHLANQTRHTT